MLRKGANLHAIQLNIFVPKLLYTPQQTGRTVKENKQPSAVGENNIVFSVSLLELVTSILASFAEPLHEKLRK